jgi:hypothetical protein
MTNNITCCFVWTCKLVSYSKGQTQIEGVWEQSADENICWTCGGRGSKKMEKAVLLQNLNSTQPCRTKKKWEGQVMYKAKQSRYTPWWRLGGEEYSAYSFLTSALEGGGGLRGQRHAPAALCPGERTPGTHCTGGWVGLRAGLDTEVRGKLLCPCRGSNHYCRSSSP